MAPMTTAPTRAQAARRPADAGVDADPQEAPTRYGIVDSPVGPLTLTGTGSGADLVITGCWFDPSEKQPDRTVGLARDDDAFAEAAAQLDAYFRGDRVAFDLPLQPIGTAFQRAVWLRLREIPYGETRTYGQIAAELGDRNASRAVGLANGRNPISVIVPCHRVIGADGSLTGFGGGLERKRHLLDLESGALPLL